MSSTATDSKMDDTSGQGSRTLAVWYTYGMTFKLGVERKGLGAAVPILTPNYLRGETEVRLDHILQVWHLGQQLLSPFGWKISRNVLARFSAL